MDMVNIKINGMSYEVAAGSTILEAAREAGIDIPTLCFLKDVNQIGACRMCMVEVKGAKSLEMCIRDSPHTFCQGEKEPVNFRRKRANDSI